MTYKYALQDLPFRDRLGRALRLRRLPGRDDEPVGLRARERVRRVRHDTLHRWRQPSTRGI